MPSFDAINYSLRPSKAIQRQLIFEGIRELHGQLLLSDSVYVGLGSVWFTDFVLAHEILNIKHMVSIEEDEIGFARPGAVQCTLRNRASAARVVD